MRKGQTLRVTATRVFRNVLRVFWNARAKYCTRHHSSRTCRHMVQLMVQVGTFLCNQRQRPADAASSSINESEQPHWAGCADLPAALTGR